MNETTSLGLARAAILVCALAIPAASVAQTAPANAPSTATALPKAAQAKVDEHIKMLHDQLKITAAEQPQWDQFADVMRDNAATMNEAFMDRGAKLAEMTAPDNMRSYATLAQVHAEDTQKLAGAFQTLYDTFPDQQKKVADTLFRDTAKARSHGH